MNLERFEDIISISTIQVALHQLKDPKVLSEYKNSLGVILKTSLWGCNLDFFRKQRDRSDKKGKQVTSNPTLFLPCP